MPDPHPNATKSQSLGAFFLSSLNVPKFLQFLCCRQPEVSLIPEPDISVKPLHSFKLLLWIYKSWNIYPFSSKYEQVIASWLVKGESLENIDYIKCHPECVSQLHGSHLRQQRGLFANLIAILVTVSSTNSTSQQPLDHRMLIHHHLIKKKEPIFSGGTRSPDFHQTWQAKRRQMSYIIGVGG